MWIIFIHTDVLMLLSQPFQITIFVFSLVKHIIYVMDINSYFWVTQMMQMYICDLFFQYGTKNHRAAVVFVTWRWIGK